MPARAGMRSRATSTTADWRSATTPRRTRSGRQLWAEKIGCSAARTPAARVRPRSTRSCERPGSTASSPRPGSPTSSHASEASDQPARRAAALEHRETGDAKRRRLSQHVNARSRQPRPPLTNRGWSNTKARHRPGDEIYHGGRSKWTGQTGLFNTIDFASSPTRLRA